jgi:hypothetical protein
MPNTFDERYWENLIHKLVDSQPFIFDPAFIPKPETPVVFHLHGAIDWPESLVLTEGKYFKKENIQVYWGDANLNYVDKKN